MSAASGGKEPWQQEGLGVGACAIAAPPSGRWSRVARGPSAAAFRRCVYVLWQTHVRRVGGSSCLAATRSAAAAATASRPRLHSPSVPPCCVRWRGLSAGTHLPRRHSAVRTFWLVLLLPVGTLELRVPAPTKPILPAAERPALPRRTTQTPSSRPAARAPPPPPPPWHVQLTLEVRW